LVAALLLLAWAISRFGASAWQLPVQKQRQDNPALRLRPAVILSLFTVVLLRSYAGLSFDFPHHGISSWLPWQVSAVVLGKAAGGLLADRYGLVRTVNASLLTAAIAFLFPNSALLCLLAVFCFNMTMPLTLWLLAAELPGMKGFAFGLLTMALFIGYLPAQLDLLFFASLPVILATISLISLALLRGTTLRPAS